MIHQCSIDLTAYTFGLFCVLQFKGILKLCIFYIYMVKDEKSNVILKNNYQITSSLVDIELR